MTYGVPDEEFRARLLAAKEARHFNIEEMCRMCKTSRFIMEKWLAGDDTPHHIGRESVLRAVE
jgi:hypothetical protein